MAAPSRGAWCRVTAPANASRSLPVFCRYRVLVAFVFFSQPPLPSMYLRVSRWLSRITLFFSSPKKYRVPRHARRRGQLVRQGVGLVQLRERDRRGGFEPFRQVSSTSLFLNSRASQVAPVHGRCFSRHPLSRKIVIFQIAYFCVFYLHGLPCCVCKLSFCAYGCCCCSSGATAAAFEPRTACDGALVFPSAATWDILLPLQYITFFLPMHTPNPCSLSRVFLLSRAGTCPSR